MLGLALSSEHISSKGQQRGKMILTNCNCVRVHDGGRGGVPTDFMVTSIQLHMILRSSKYKFASFNSLIIIFQKLVALENCLLHKSTEKGGESYSKLNRKTNY